MAVGILPTASQWYFIPPILTTWRIWCWFWAFRTTLDRALIRRGCLDFWIRVWGPIPKQGSRMNEGKVNEKNVMELQKEGEESIDFRFCARRRWATELIKGRNHIIPGVGGTNYLHVCHLPARLCARWRKTVTYHEINEAIAWNYLPFSVSLRCDRISNDTQSKIHHLISLVVWQYPLKSSCKVFAADCAWTAMAPLPCFPQAVSASTYHYTPSRLHAIRQCVAMSIITVANMRCSRTTTIYEHDITCMRVRGCLSVVMAT